MARSAEAFLEDWRESYIYAEGRGVEQLDEMIALCVSDAEKEGLTKEDLEKASGGLLAYIRAAIIKVNSVDG